MVHPWCQDVPRDEAVRAAEDAAASERPPLPEWRDLPERVARLEALLSRSGKNAPSDGDSDAKCTERESSADAEPVAFGVRFRSGNYKGFLFRSEKDARTQCDLGSDVVVPFFDAPPPPRGWLSEEEREYLDALAADFEEDANRMHDAGSPDRAVLWERKAGLIRGLLSRVTDTEPRGWLTEEEREAVETARDYFDDDDHGDSECVFIARVLKQLLARNSPPRVRLPVFSYARKWSTIADLVSGIEQDWRAALAAAGVEVGE